MNAADGDRSIPTDRIVERWREASPSKEGFSAMVRFDGFIGEETDEGRVLLYDSDDSTHVIQIPKSAIRVIEPEDPALTPLNGRALWVDAGAECLHIVPDMGPETFLAGAIAEGAYGLLLDESGYLRCTKWKSFSRR